MVIFLTSLNRLAASFLLAVAFSVPAVAQGADSAELDRLYAELAKPDQPGWQQIEDEILREWSKSGSPAMDLLLQRGTDALNAGDFPSAIEHLTALTDHAPEFAQGWNALATAYYRSQLYGPAIDDIRKTLDLNPHHFGALSGLAIIMEELGYEKEALEAYRAVLAIHPHRPNLKEAVERLERKVEGDNI